MNCKAEFNKIWVIESLPKGDLKTGRNLFDSQLRKATFDHPKLNISYKDPENKQNSLKVLENIRDEAKDYGNYPIIHFECHGTPDGLATTNGEQIGWYELRKILIEINYACRLNHVIVLAACNGAHMIKVATMLDRAPFCAIIGSEDEVKASDAEKDFGVFYTEYFKNLDANTAISALNQEGAGINRRYQFYYAVGLFIEKYKIYHKDYCSGKGLRQRKEELLTQKLIDPILSSDITSARQQVKEGLAKKEEHFNNSKNRFFFIDCFAENAERFKEVSYQYVLAYTKP